VGGPALGYASDFYLYNSHKAFRGRLQSTALPAGAGRPKGKRGRKGTRWWLHRSYNPSRPCPSAPGYTAREGGEERMTTALFTSALEGTHPKNGRGGVITKKKEEKGRSTRSCNFSVLTLSQLRAATEPGGGRPSTASPRVGGGNRGKKGGGSLSRPSQRFVASMRRRGKEEVAPKVVAKDTPLGSSPTDRDGEKGEKKKEGGPRRQGINPLALPPYSAPARDMGETRSTQPRTTPKKKGEEGGEEMFRIPMPSTHPARSIIITLLIMLSILRNHASPGVPAFGRNTGEEKKKDGRLSYLSFSLLLLNRV